MGNQTVPVVPALRWKEIGKIADNFLRKFDSNLLSTASPFPLDEYFEFHMREELGFDHAVSELPVGVEAAMDPVRKTVTLSPFVYEELQIGTGRARFTVAHEIGHIVMHAPWLQAVLEDGRNVLKLNRSSIPAYLDPECQANAFASALLMPTVLVASILQQGGNWLDIHRQFEVSPEAARYRVTNLEKFL